jgi:folate-binding Fe-S cluster repair protein YgfZ
LETIAVSYDKGCYLGQEVMARLKSRGKIRRHLRRVEGIGAVPALPAGLFQEGKKAGELRSAVALPAGGYLGLALMGANPFDAGRPLSLGAEAAATVRFAVAHEK